MFREMHYANRNYRAMDLAENIAERRRHSLAATSKPSRQVRLTRMLLRLPCPLVACRITALGGVWVTKGI